MTNLQDSRSQSHFYSNGHQVSFLHVHMEGTGATTTQGSPILSVFTAAQGRENLAALKKALAKQQDGFILPNLDTWVGIVFNILRGETWRTYAEHDGSPVGALRERTRPEIKVHAEKGLFSHRKTGQ